jgi:hypothetical protein
MDKIKHLEVKKLIKELNFVESDYTYKNEMVNEIENLFIESVNKFLDKHSELKEIFDKKINRKIENIFKEKFETIQEKNDDDLLEESTTGINKEVVVDIKVKKIRHLYRQIAKATHPDRTQNKKLNEIYLRATKCYDLLDIPGTYSICEELDIIYEIDEEDYNLISEKIEKLKQVINFMESTLTWKWYKSNDEVEKTQIIINYIKNRLDD